MKYEIVVSGTVLDDSDDELIANAMAENLRTIGWKNVSVRKVKKGK